MVERQQVIEIAVAVTAVFLMLGTMLWIGAEYGGSDSILSSDGADLLVGAIVGFILLLTAAGIGMAFLVNGPEDDLDDEDEVDTQSAF